MPCPECGSIGELCRECALRIEASARRAGFGPALTLWDLAGLRAREQIKGAKAPVRQPRR